MLKGANTELFNPLVAKAHNCECQNIIFPLKIKPLKVDSKLKMADFYFCTLSTNG